MFRIKGLTKKTIKRLSSIEEVIFILDEFNFVAKSGLKTTQKALELELRTTFKKEENAFDRKITVKSNTIAKMQKKFTATQ